MTGETSVIGLFCDDVREEKGGTTTMVGIIPDNMEIHQPPPLAIPKFGLYIRVHMDVESKPVPITARLVMTDGTELSLGGFEIEAVADGLKVARESGLPLGGFVIGGLLSPLQISKTGNMTAFVSVGDKQFTAANLRIKLAEKAENSTSTTAV